MTLRAMADEGQGAIQIRIHGRLRVRADRGLDHLGNGLLELAPEILDQRGFDGGAFPGD